MLGFHPIAGEAIAALPSGGAQALVLIATEANATAVAVQTTLIGLQVVAAPTPATATAESVVGSLQLGSQVVVELEWFIDGHLQDTSSTPLLFDTVVDSLAAAPAEATATAVPTTLTGGAFFIDAVPAEATAAVPTTTLVQGASPLQLTTAGPAEATATTVATTLGVTSAPNIVTAVPAEAQATAVSTTLVQIAAQTIGANPSDAQATLAATVLLIRPAAPSITVVALSSSQVQVSWTPIVGATAYRVERRISGGVFATIVPSTSASLITDFVAAATTYDYRVYATNGLESAASTTQSVTTPTATTAFDQYSDTADAFTADQQFDWRVDLWDTPFPAIANDVASSGLPFWVRQVRTDGVFTLRSAVQAASAATLKTVFTDDANSLGVITDGRMPAAKLYWAGGAPGFHGVSTAGRVGYFIEAVVRPAAERSWFSVLTAITNFQFALGGSGYCRIVTRTGGVATERFNGQLRESDFLLNGLQTSTAFTLQTGDIIQIAYVQDVDDPWGGFVVKAVTNLPTTAAARATALREAPVLTHGLADSGTATTRQQLALIESVEMQTQLGSVPRATIRVPLVTNAVTDGFGWVWEPDTPSQLSTLTCRLPTGDVTVQRGRTLQVRGGYASQVGSTLPVLFTGIIDDFDAQQGSATITVVGVEQRAIDQFVKNFPDKISYMAAQFRQTSGTSEPVFDTPAYDAWPIETAVLDLLGRAGLDESLFRQALEVPNATGALVPATLEGSAYTTFRARTLTGRPVRLERAINYGNTGVSFTDATPVDDPYLFGPENTADLWSHARKFTERYGFDLYSNAAGQVVLQARNSPQTVRKFTTAIGGTARVNPSAIAGTYREMTGTLSVVQTVIAARVDLVVGRSAGQAAFSYSVRRVSDNVQVSAGTITPTATAPTFFYDGRDQADGTNACVVTLYSGRYDQYEVTLSSGTSGTRWLDGFLLYHTDPVKPLFSSAFSNARNASEIRAEGTANDRRNLVTVVGRRTAVVTDSQKFDANPENTQYEFVVQRAVDVRSITDPTASNYTGYAREAIIYDTKIADQDFAAYLARTFIYRQRLPRPNAEVTHTLLPIVGLRMPIYVADEAFQTVGPSTVRFVQSLRHRLTASRVDTTISATSLAEFPSYQPREDLDIDDPTLGYAGQPVANIDISYTSLTGHAKRNLSSSAVRLVDEDNIAQLFDVSVTAGSPWPYLQIGGSEPWPPIAGTLFLRAAGAGNSSIGSSTVTTFPTTGRFTPTGSNGGRFETVLNTAFQLVSVELLTFTQGVFGGTYAPAAVTLTTDASQPAYYSFDRTTRRLAVTVPQRNPAGVSGGGLSTGGATREYQFRVTYRAAPQASLAGWFADNPYHHFTNIDYANRRIYLPWMQADNSTPYQRTISRFDVRYEALAGDYAGGESPFYDAYTSEIGNLVKVSLDTLVSGQYRISIRSLDGSDQVVAWLTEPTVDASDPAKHWQFVSAGTARTWFWDGVDQVGEWNKRQSRRYAEQATGFTEQKPVVGSGFYAWNKEEGVDTGGFAPVALISGSTTNSVPVFGHGTFGRWYLHVECRNDTLQANFEAAPTDVTRQMPRTVRSTALTPSLHGGSSAALVFTHLPKPTQVALSVADWVGSNFDRTNESASGSGINNGTNWGTLNTDASIRNDRPVRLRFTVQPRPGVLWSGRQDAVSVKLTRNAHVGIHLFDQFVVYRGTNWPGTAVEEREVISRRLTNHDHTVQFVDDGFRKASTFKQTDGGTGTEWIFIPSDFKKDFNGVTEALQYGSYTQVEEVPFWDVSGGVSGTRSRLQLSLMNYLFYLSAASQDRSGRYQWCLNTGFVDRSKIVTNAVGDWFAPGTSTVANASTYRQPWPDDPVYQHRRTIVCRQWEPEPSWVQAQRAQFGLSTGSVGDLLLWHRWADHDVTATTLNGTAWSGLNLPTDVYSAGHRSALSSLPAAYADLRRQLGTGSGSGGTALGSWTWLEGPLWVPCITRDFHPYFFVPPMVDKRAPSDGGVDYRRDNQYAQVDDRPYTSGGDDATRNTGDDCAGLERWSSTARDYSGTTRRFWVGTKTLPKASNTAGQALTETNSNLLITSSTIDYGRQDDLMHYEDLRGLYSRGPRPAEQPKKSTAGLVYWSNPVGYSGMQVKPAYRNESYPLFTADIGSFFQFTFRSEYVWESATLFPVDTNGREVLGWMNLDKVRVVPQQGWQQVRYDAGAWVGWKDDLPGPTPVVSLNTPNGSTALQVFDTGYMVAGLSTGIAGITRNMKMSLVLTPSRRGG
jgi:hypothetical protein